MLPPPLDSVAPALRLGHEKAQAEAKCAALLRQRPALGIEQVMACPGMRRSLRSFLVQPKELGLFFGIGFGLYFVFAFGVFFGGFFGSLLALGSPVGAVWLWWRLRHRNPRQVFQLSPIHRIIGPAAAGNPLISFDAQGKMRLSELRRAFAVGSDESLLDIHFLNGNYAGTLFSSGKFLRFDKQSFVPVDLSSLVKAAFAAVAEAWELRCEITRLENSHRIAALEEKRDQAWQRVFISEATKAALLQCCEQFQRGGKSAPRGLLLHGPPGTGKTHIAKSIADSVDAQFMGLSLPDLKAGYIGQSGQKVREIWNKARASRTVLFIDECEGVFGRRGGLDTDRFSEEITQAFLAEWDGIQAKNGMSTVWVIGATNRRDLIDPAILSRFDVETEVPLPGAVDRAKILTAELASHDLRFEEPPDWSDLSQGMSGRDLANLAKTLARSVPTGHTIGRDELVGALKGARGKGRTKVSEKASWENLVLAPTTLKELHSLAKRFRHAEAFALRGIDTPRGMILFGPPGTGKTQIARTLANESGLSFIGASTSDLKAGYVGQSGQKVREIFERARSQTPCILFIDEIDVVAPSRGAMNSSDQFTAEIVGQLLQEIDGIKEHDGRFFLLAATNHLDHVDSAVLSRFPSKVEIPLPDPEGRRALLRAFLAGKPHAVSDATLERVVQASEGRSGRDLQGLVMQAISHTVDRAGDQPESVLIQDEDFPA